VPSKHSFLLSNVASDVGMNSGIVRLRRAYFLVLECAHCKGFRPGGILATDSSLSPVATQMKRFVASGHDS